MDTLRGHLLIAGASLWDPNFRRSVVLIGITTTTEPWVSC